MSADILLSSVGESKPVTTFENLGFYLSLARSTSVVVYKITFVGKMVAIYSVSW